MVFLRLKKLTKYYPENKSQKNQYAIFPPQGTQRGIILTHPQKFMPSIQETDNTFQEVEKLTSPLKLIIEEEVSTHYVKEECILSSNY
jgi:hypothetical protein